MHTNGPRNCAIQLPIQNSLKFHSSWLSCKALFMASPQPAEGETRISSAHVQSDQNNFRKVLPTSKMSSILICIVFVSLVTLLSIGASALPTFEISTAPVASQQYDGPKNPFFMVNFRLNFQIAGLTKYYEVKLVGAHKNWLCTAVVVHFPRFLHPLITLKHSNYS